MDREKQNRILKSHGYRWEKITQDWLDDNDDFDTRPGWHLYAPNNRGEVSVSRAMREIEIGVAAVEAEIAVEKQAEFQAWAMRQEALAIKNKVEQLVIKFGTRPDGEQPDGMVLLDTQNIYGGGDWFVASPDRKTLWYIRNNGMDGDSWSNNNVRTGGAGAMGWKLETLPDTDPDEIPNLIRQLEAVISKYNGMNTE